VAHVVVGAAFGQCIGNIRAVRSSASIWDFSYTHSTTAFSGGGRQVEPDDVGDLGDQFRIGGELERLRPRLLLQPVQAAALIAAAARRSPSGG
jgi:hypothetical protein